MSVPPFEAVQSVYERHWEHAEILPHRLPHIEAAADHVLANKQRYQAIEDHEGIPWVLVGCLHLREADCNFKCHLHNGDPLTKRTVHVPAGRPLGNPPFTWEESARDALTMPPHELQKIKGWSPARIGYEAEKYNGWGYYTKGRLSPYDWAGETEDGSREMATGKYVRDHVFDASVIDSQPGVMAVLKVLMQKDPSIKFIQGPKAPQVPSVPTGHASSPAASAASPKAAPEASKAPAAPTNIWVSIGNVLSGIVHALSPRK